MYAYILFVEGWANSGLRSGNRKLFLTPNLTNGFCSTHDMGTNNDVQQFRRLSAEVKWCLLATVVGSQF